MTTETTAGFTETPSGTEPYRYRWIALFVILAVEVMDLLDSLVTNVAGPSIRSELNGSYALIQWLGAAYTLAMAIGLLTGGRLGDILGRRRMFIIGAAGFALASLACGLAQAPAELIAFRAVQGLFGAVMIPQGLGMIKQMFSPSEQTKAFGAFGPVMALGAVGGPVLSGWLVSADYFGIGWRMIFFINLPLGLFAVIGALRFLPELRAARAPRLDIPGVILAAAGAFLLLFPLVQGRELGWPAWSFVMLAAGVVVFGLFAYYEGGRERRGVDPLVTPSLFRKRAFTGGLVLGMVFFGALIGTGLIFTLYLQVGLGYSPLKAGLSSVPQALGTLVGFAAAGAGLAEKYGRKLLQLGTVLMALAVVGFTLTVLLVGTGINPFQMAPSLVVLGAGMGLAMAPFFGIVLAGVSDQETGSASGALNSVQQLGGAFGIAVLGTVFFALLPGAVVHHVDDSASQLRTVLTTAGVPASAQPAVVSGLRTCLSDRLKENDPDAVPASCRSNTSTQSPQIAAYASAEVREGFRDATVRTTLVALLMVLAAFGLSFLLPRFARPESAGH